VKTHIICFGNPWHGDDGFGPAVFEQLHGAKLPKGTHIYDAGCNSLSAMPLLLDCDLVIIVDACHNEQAQPGTLGWLEPEDVSDEQTHCSHSGDVAELLMHLPILFADNPSPQLRLLVAAIADIQPFSPTLSQAIKQIIPNAIDEIHQLILRQQRFCA